MAGVRSKRINAVPMIDTDEIKPASDAVQAAFAAYSDAGQAYALERNRHPHDAVSLQRAYEATPGSNKETTQESSDDV